MDKKAARRSKRFGKSNQGAHQDHFAGENAYPRLLKGRKLSGMVLPGNFDTSLHHASKGSATITGTSLSKLAKRIAALKNRSIKRG